MLLFLITCFYFTRYNASAIPVATSLDGADVESFFGPNVGRSLWDIVKSCLATIFACTWIAVHRNMPHPEARWYVVIWERIKITVLALLAPEWILGWALCQYFSARRLVKELTKEAQIFAEKRERLCTFLL